MSRRIRTAALVSATSLLIGGSLSLGLAPTASADLPNGAALSVDKPTPMIGETVYLSGDKCEAVASPQAAAAATSSAPTDVPADVPTGGLLDASVAITVSTPSGDTNDTATPDGDGRWTADAGVKIDQAGTYTFNATCNAGALGDGGPYKAISVEVDAQAVTPHLIVTPGDGATVAPGDTVTVAGVDLTEATTVSVSLTGFATETRPVDQGAFGSVDFLIPSIPGTNTLSGTVDPDVGDTLSFSVVVVGPSPSPTPTTTTPPSADGSVSAGDDDTDYGSGYGSGYTASKPTLPNTGTDTVWPGIVGALLVLSGAGLVWSGRRREQAGTHAA